MHSRMRRCSKQMFYMFELKNKVVKQIYEELNIKLVCNVCYIMFALCSVNNEILQLDKERLSCS